MHVMREFFVEHMNRGRTESLLEQECIPVGCVPSAAVAGSLAMHRPPPPRHTRLLPCHACMVAPPRHTHPLPCTPSCHACPHRGQSDACEKHYLCGRYKSKLFIGYYVLTNIFELHSYHIPSSPRTINYITAYDSCNT